MPLTPKITELLSKKYNPNVTIFGNYDRSKSASILDHDNGTTFIISENTLFSFKDQHRNHWMTLVQSFPSNGEQYTPKLGELYVANDGIKYNFTTKEEILEMAVKYFEKHKHNIE